MTDSVRIPDSETAGMEMERNNKERRDPALLVVKFSGVATREGYHYRPGIPALIRCWHGEDYQRATLVALSPCTRM